MTACESVENLIPLSDLARMIPARDGKRLKVGTVRQWALRGIKGIRLETVRIGGRKMVSRDALRRFFEATTEATSTGRAGKGDVG